MNYISSDLIETLQEAASSYSVKFLTALTVLAVSIFIYRGIMALLRILFQKKTWNESLESFIYSLIGIVLRVAIVFILLCVLGVPMTSFIALLGSIGLALGLALQGSLSNFAGGVLILSFKPYVVGDYVKIGQYAGTVSDIQTFNTVLKTLQNETVVIPNSITSNSEVVNYTTEKERRLDLLFSVSYDTDLKEAKEVILSTLEGIDGIIDKEEPKVVVKSLSESSVDLQLQIWIDIGSYVDIRDELMTKVKVALDSKGIEIPYPKRDVYVHNV